MNNRRQILERSAAVASLMCAAGLLPGVAAAQTQAYRTAAFDAKNMAELMKALGASAPAESKEVALNGPDIAEDGALVPISIATSLSGARRFVLLVEKNPGMLSAIFELSDAVDASISTRIKMSQSSNVVAVAMMADGRNLFAQREIRVTLGGCGA